MKVGENIFWGKLVAISLIVFYVMLPFLVNGKPIILYTGSEYVFPVFQSQSEVVVDGKKMRDVNFKKTSFAATLEKTGGWMVWPIIPFSRDEVDESLSSAPQPPTAEHLLGVDCFGHDVLAMILYALRKDLLYAIFITIMTFVCGAILGSIQGYIGGMLDLIGQRVAEVWLSLPEMIVLLLLLSSGRVSQWGLCLWISFSHSLRVMSSIRVQVLKVRTYGYVMMSRIMGLSGLHIFRHHIVPSLIPIIRAKAPFEFSSTLSLLSAITYFYGSFDSTPSLGNLLHQGRIYFFCAPWILLSSLAFVCVIIVSLSFWVQRVKSREVRDA